MDEEGVGHEEDPLVVVGREVSLGHRCLARGEDIDVCVEDKIGLVVSNRLKREGFNVGCIGALSLSLSDIFITGVGRVQGVN